MVSELSARLMRGNNYNAPPTGTKLLADHTGSRTLCVSPISEHEPMMTISACTAKLQKISTQSHRKKQARASLAIEDTCFKRRKVDELQFAASKVKEDLAKGGLPYPSLDATLRHHLDVDATEDLTRGVSLVGASSVASSPFLTSNQSKCSENASMCDFGSLFSATYACYNKPAAAAVETPFMMMSSNATFVTNSDVGSICSVTSDNSSESSYIAPRLEDGLKNSNKEVVVEPTPENKEQLEATALQRHAIYSNPITIRDAFENSDEARIVTLSFAPFLVAHVNPAYTRMTGRFPSAILGKPFHEVIEDPTCKANTAKATSLTSLHEKVTTFSQADADNNNNQCRIHISVVGPEPADRPTKGWDHQNAITHYMIALKETKEDEDEVASTTSTGTSLSSILEDAPTVSISNTTSMRPMVVPPVQFWNIPTWPVCPRCAFIVVSWAELN